MQDLAGLPIGASATVANVTGPRAYRRRLLEMGLVPGTAVAVSRVAPFGDPLMVSVRQGQWSLRRAEASQVAVTNVQLASNAHAAAASVSAPANAVAGEARIANVRAGASAVVEAPTSLASSTVGPVAARRVVLAGNPNVGKTTLFNALTGARAKVTNYPGVTVEQHHGMIRHGGVPYEIVDLPGTYSLVARSAEEQIALNGIVGIAPAPAPDVVVVCVDATQPTRSLYLLLQCQELGARVVVALTMVDEARASAPNAAALGAALGCDVVPVRAVQGEGLQELSNAIARAAALPSAAAVWRWQPQAALAEALSAVRAALPAGWPSSDALALWALQSVAADSELANVPAALENAVATHALSEASDDEAVLGRWRWLDATVPALIAGAPDRTATERVDRVLLHRGWGTLAFAAMMTLLFLSLFAWSAPLIDGIEKIMAYLGGGLRDALGEGVWVDFVVDGVWGGIATVLVFLPQIVLLFFFLGLLEDLGYLARVAYLMDRVMRSMNLHGRAFVPMLSGFACAVPAIMATRTLERRRDRILTMLVIPLTTCSARLPVYTLVIAAMMPGSTATQGLIMAAMYAFSVVMALVAAWVMSKTVKPLRAKRLPFFVELPPYRMPRRRQVVGLMRRNAVAFLRDAGRTIVIGSVVLWAALYFPRTLPPGAPDFAAKIAASANAEAKAAVQAEQAALRLQESYAGRFGRAIEPAIAPLGFDWKIGIAIVGSFAAREVFVATLGMVVGVDASEDDTSLRASLRGSKRADGRPQYTPLIGLSLLLFFALACQCISTVATVRRETQSYRWPLFLFVYMTVLAYVVSLLVYQGGRVLGFS